MSLSYHFTFSAPATATADELLEFLKSVESDAKGMGFKPTMVLEAVFDTPERREFARRVVRASRSEFRPRRERQSRFGSFAPGGWWKRHPAGFSNQTWRRHGLNRIGTYNPDWAILKHDDTVLYLVRETKGTKNFEKLRNSEAEKIRCGRKHFETLKVDFDVVTAAGEV
jgi:hypothetical protein